MKINELVEKFEKFLGIDIRCEDTKKYSLYYHGDKIKHANVKDVEILDWRMNGSYTLSFNSTPYNIMSLIVIVSEKDYVMLMEEIKERKQKINQAELEIIELLDKQREIKKKQEDLEEITGEINDDL